MNIKGSEEETIRNFTISELLHPENLDKTCIIKLLKQRYIGKKLFKNLEKVELVEIYHDTILPHPQRVYRKTRRGSLLTKLRDGSILEKTTTECDPMQSSGTTITIMTSVPKRKLDSEEDIQGIKKITSLIKDTLTSPVKELNDKYSNKHKTSPQNLNGTSKSTKLLTQISNGHDTAESIDKKCEKRTSQDSEGCNMEEMNAKKHKTITWP